jgi:hypothetical protein
MDQINSARVRLSKEIRHFSFVSLLNLVFAAIVVAFGITYIAAMATGYGTASGVAGLRILTGAIAMVSFGLGISWILVSVRIFKDMRKIRDDLAGTGEAATEDRITCLIVRMFAYYRDNRYAIRKMILIGTLGGCVFFLLAIAGSTQLLEITGTGGQVSLDPLLLIPTMLLDLGIAFVSLFSSYYLWKFSEAYDRRLHEIGRSECALQEQLGRDGV